VLDWGPCIPAPVPDDQNFFKAPKMEEWFVKDSTRSLVSPPGKGTQPFLPFEPSTADLDLVRIALQRPYARIDGDYRQPYAIPIPNFVTIRNVSQLLAQRAQSDLSLGQSEAAWHELSLIRDLCRILEPQPSGRPMTLVAAMINVAVTGLYVGVVQDGLRLHAWHEPQLLAIERQLHEADLLAPVVEAFREERAATCRTFETTKPSEMVKLFDFGTAGRSWRDRFGDTAFKLIVRWMPRGWFYQNMAMGSELEQEEIESVDLTSRLVRPHQVSAIVGRLSSISEQRSPYRFLVARALPYFAKAWLTTAASQTLVDQAWLACALERYRLAQGQYPETLDALTPRFLAKLPHDLIGGQPLTYRRDGSGGYLVYSVGWNEQDDGGTPGRSKEQGDWVWELR
jgi:hypothetical protein